MKTKPEHFSRKERLEICERLNISESALRRRMSNWGIKRAISQPRTKGKDVLKEHRERFFGPCKPSSAKPTETGDTKPQRLSAEDAKFCASRKRINDLVRKREEELLLKDACQEVWDDPLGELG